MLESSSLSPRPPIGESFGDVARGIVGLARAETALFRAEMQSKTEGFVTGAVALVLAVMLISLALLAGGAALILWLITFGFSPPVAAAITAAALLILGVVAVMVGLSKIRTLSLMPDRTLAQISKDFDMLTGSSRHE